MSNEYWSSTSGHMDMTRMILGYRDYILNRNLGVLGYYEVPRPPRDAGAEGDQAKEKRPQGRTEV